jgi:hypothetical protein
MRSDRYFVVHKDLVITSKSYVQVYFITAATGAMAAISSTKGVAHSEWDKVYFIKLAKGAIDGLYFLLVEIDGNLQLQSMLFNNIAPYNLVPGDRL